MSNPKKKNLTSPPSETDTFAEQLAKDRNLPFSHFARLQNVETPEQLQMVVIMNLLASLCREVNAMRRNTREERADVYLLTEYQTIMFNAATKEISARGRDEDGEETPAQNEGSISVHHANEVFIRKAG